MTRNARCRLLGSRRKRCVLIASFLAVFWLYHLVVVSRHTIWIHTTNEQSHRSPSEHFRKEGEGHFGFMFTPMRQTPVQYVMRHRVVPSAAYEKANPLLGAASISKEGPQTLECRIPVSNATWLSPIAADSANSKLHSLCEVVELNSSSIASGQTRLKTLDLQRWLQRTFDLGVDHIYVCDNSSRPSSHVHRILSANFDSKALTYRTKREPKSNTPNGTLKKEKATHPEKVVAHKCKRVITIALTEELFQHTTGISNGSEQDKAAFINSYWTWWTTTYNDTSTNSTMTKGGGSVVQLLGENAAQNEMLQNVRWRLEQLHRGSNATIHHIKKNKPLLYGLLAVKFIILSLIFPMGI